MGIGATFKRMVVVVILFAALSSESCMTDIRTLRWWRRTQSNPCRKVRKRLYIAACVSFELPDFEYLSGRNHLKVSIFITDQKLNRCSCVGRHGSGSLIEPLSPKIWLF